MTHYLVTGGAGFIGSHLVAKLSEDEARVRIADNLSTGSTDNLAGAADHCEMLFGDLSDPDFAAHAVEGIDVIFHLAALPSVPLSVDDPVHSHQHTLTSTVTVLDAARRAGVKRLVLASSCGVYGERPELPKREEHATQTLSPYTAAKLAAEHYCESFSACYDLETVALRYFNVYGPRQDPDSPYSAVIPLFIRSILAGESPKIFGDGTQSRDFVYVEDVVQANLLAAKATGVAGKTFNIGTGKATSLLDLIEQLGSILDRKIEPQFLPERTGDVKHSWADISAARAQLGFSPQFDLAAGLQRTADAFESSRE